jgi:uncharacterized protein YceK
MRVVSVLILIMILVQGCSTIKEVYSAKDKKCLRDMEWAMRGVDKYIWFNGIVPIEAKKQWFDVKYECWREGPVE